MFSAVAKGSDDATLAIGCARPRSIRTRCRSRSRCSATSRPPTAATPSSSRPSSARPAAPRSATPPARRRSSSSRSAARRTARRRAWPATRPTRTCSGPPDPRPAPRGASLHSTRTRRSAARGNVEVSLRAMTADLSPIGAGESPALAAGSIYLPNGPTFPAPPAPFAQSAPAAAFLNGKYYVVFQDDTRTTQTGQDIHLRSMDGALVAEQGATPLGINGGPAGTGGTSGSRRGSHPGRAVDRRRAARSPLHRLGGHGPGEDRRAHALAPEHARQPERPQHRQRQQGRVGRGDDARAGSPSGRAAPASSCASSTRTARPRAASRPSTRAAPPRERPRVASLPDGRFAVAWSAGGDVFVQRYDTKGAKVAGDQASPVNDVVKDGEQVTPSIASTHRRGRVVRRGVARREHRATFVRACSAARRASSSTT